MSYIPVIFCWKFRIMKKEFKFIASWNLIENNAVLLETP
jgi:hypothetical protein